MSTKTLAYVIVTLFLGLAAAGPTASGTEPTARLSLLRVPEGGIQPQTALDAKGTVHVVYFRGDPRHGDLMYVRARDGETLSQPVRVNSEADSAIAVGNIRGAHLAVGKNGRIHVAWMGAERAAPRAPTEAVPMLYTRLNDDNTAFEPQRNIIQTAVGLDGGGSVAADGEGNVYVAWHAPEPGTKGEENRRVWLARSEDEGRTFLREKAISPAGTGACGCCGLRAFCDCKANVYLMYRAAAEKVHRDSYLLISRNHGASFQAEDLGPWRINACPMSSFALAEGGGRIFAGWETNGQVSFLAIDPASGRHGKPVSAPGAGHARKHPVVAADDKGETILVWTDGMGWQRGGDVAWQVFDRDGKPSLDAGKAQGVPVWSLVAVIRRPGGGFTVVY